MSNAVQITRFAVNQNGTRRVGLELNGVDVLLTPGVGSTQAAADRLALRIADAAAEDAAAVAKIAALSKELEQQRMLTLQHAARAGRLGEQLEAALHGRRRFLGPVLMKPVLAGNWGGEVWLLDPEKRERGFGLRFGSTAEVHSAHPELFVVGHTSEGVLLDAWGESR